MIAAQPSAVHLASPAVTAPSPQHLEQIAAARALGRSIKRAATVATLSAWTMAIFGALTMLTSLGSINGTVLGVIMCVLAHFEFKGAHQIRRLDPAAPVLLGRNQILLGIALVIYASVALHGTLTRPSALDVALHNEPLLQQTFGSIAELERQIYIAVYGGMIAGSVFGCGGAAIYYLTRKRAISTYLRNTPTWILELQKAGMTIC